MPSHAYAGHMVDVNDEGYLSKPSDWNREIGEAIASELGIAMTPEHWKVVAYAQRDFAETGQTPGLRRITVNTSVGMKDLYQLFPKGPGKLIAKIGGIPKPKSCL